MIETVYKIPGAPRIALLADLHNHSYAAVISSLRAYRPSLIAVAGDVVTGWHPEDDKSPLETQKNVKPFFSACAAVAPTFFSLGNHERFLDQQDLKEIRELGVTVLDNEWLRKDGVVIGGLTSAAVTAYRQHKQPGERYPRLTERVAERAPETAWLDDYAAAEGFHILLSHHPEYVSYVPSSVELILSGHAHGGQWRIFNPFKREWVGVFSPGQGLWPKYTKGVYDERLVVSTGLSNTASVPRFFNPTQLVYIEDVKPQDSRLSRFAVGKYKTR